MGGQSYASVNDRGARTAIDFGVYGVPETFFIGPDGVVAYKHIGPVTERVLHRADRANPSANAHDAVNFCGLGHSCALRMGPAIHRL